MPLNDNAPPATGTTNGALHPMVTVASEAQMSDEEVPVHFTAYTAPNRLSP